MIEYSVLTDPSLFFIFPSSPNLASVTIGSLLNTPGIPSASLFVMISSNFFRLTCSDDSRSISRLSTAAPSALMFPASTIESIKVNAWAIDSAAPTWFPSRANDAESLENDCMAAEVSAAASDLLRLIVLS